MDYIMRDQIFEALVDILNDGEELSFFVGTIGFEFFL